MCGIIGVASRDLIARRDWLITGRDAMTHRGPDDAGVWWSSDRRVGFGHRRLAVVDLSAAGHQPMHDSTGLLTIVFNGEVYNFRDLQQELTAKGHVFRSHSDTEVVLVAYREWGLDCLSRINGMFAFAIYDAGRHTLFLARDRAGEKPLFYTASSGSLHFASELKGLLADRRFSWNVDPAALDLYLSMGFVPGDRCMVRGVHKLPAAHALVFDLVRGTEKIWRYWAIPLPPSVPDGRSQTEEVLQNELEVLLQDAVRRQLQADVPVGVLLSGGVDSGLITAMAVRASSRVKTFTVGFPGFGQYDESEHARLIARHFQTEHVELNAAQVDPDVLPLLARQFDEPMVDSSMIPTYLVSKLVRSHCTVVLGGDGGDELFGGYPHYNRLLSMQQRTRCLPLLLKAAIARGSKAFLPTGFMGRNWLQALGCDLNRDLPLIGELFNDIERRQLLGATVVNSPTPVAEGVWNARVPRTGDLLQRATRMDFENYMVEDILVKIDRVSMLNSLELRAPLLDYRIIEFAFGKVPSNLKATTNNRKILLKKLASKLLPKEFDGQRKQGFSVPLADWLNRGTWRSYFHEILDDPQCAFDNRTVTGLLSGQDKGRKNQERLFGLVMFELWRREYRITM